ncbi:MAG: phosphate regulon transcriptional regulator PhoB [Alphaproteobacteria bacterium]|nr:phosphate regulon transcriptional regulator PhoB [Alphaproteobacteria bacterium]MBT4017132.1 phosphate regulon transcriptional regulator PhoB [Alphaproteobacteria bacterium]MBT5161530.1 phosphate regulon transcriptional regulator PhoB [Alphaproteobacteria bacterium]
MTSQDATALILIVEDEAPQVEVLRYNLEREGYRIVVAMDGEEALEAVAIHHPDLAIIDWMLPQRSGVEICRHIRANVETQRLPIIMLTARGEESDRVLGLDSGADDYVIKPYSPREMVARVRALLRRTRPENDEGQIIFEDILLDIVSHKVTRGDKRIALGPTEYRILKVLMEKPGRVYSRERLLDRVWGSDIHVEDRTVDVHVGRLRKALKSTGGPDLIRTVRGSGYAIDNPDSI